VLPWALYSIFYKGLCGVKLSKKWTRSWARRTVVGLVAGSLCMGTPGLAMAEEKQEYTFDPVLVTAMRRESTDLKTPASVQVLSGEQLKETGASNLLEALKFTTGLTYDGYGAMGHLYSSMTAKMVIRGMDRGTVVLLDGVPTNLSGYYALEHLPPDSIEKVEIIKGASSTLYGTSAMGGVINVVTKKKVANQLTLETGSFGTNRQNLSVQADKFSFMYSHSKTGDMGAISEPWSSNGLNRKYTAFRGDTRDFFRWSWAIDKNITLVHQYDTDDFNVERMSEIGNSLFERIAQKDTKNSLALHIKHGTWTTKAYGNWQSRQYRKYSSTGARSGDNTTYFQTFGLDSQTNWNTGFGQYMAGFSWQNDSISADESFYAQSSSSSAYLAQKQRDFFSFFGQVTHALSPKTSLTLGARQEFIRQQGGANDYNEFSPQVQVLHTLNKEQSLYLNVGRAFRMPNLSDMYGSTWRKTANPNLEPESGYTYEIGWKKIGQSDALKIALYQMNFTNYIQWEQDPLHPGTYVPYNSEFRNTGLEVTYDRKLNKRWSFNAGANINNPEERRSGEEWQPTFAKFQLNGGVTYSMGKWSTSLTANYLAGRKDGLEPTLPVNLVVRYRASKNTQVQLRVENLLDRKDIISNGTSHYLSPERAFYVGVTQNF
ncbi:MAG TPA: TonB-dependent receptor, partial [Negativicutes bacterium]|nr:TonB-dependent receptor [Negativicutes bacterium]